jgi:hypothetical protein
MTSQHDKPKWWRPTFSVRTLVIVVTMVCLYAACWGPTKRRGVNDVVNFVLSSEATTQISDPHFGGDAFCGDATNCSRRFPQRCSPQLLLLVLWLRCEVAIRDGTADAPIVSGLLDPRSAELVSTF